MKLQCTVTVVIVSFCTWQAAIAQSGKETNTLAPRSEGVSCQQDNERGAQVNHHKSVRPGEQSQTVSPARTRAVAKIAVQRSAALPYDQTTSPTLIEINLTETFSGDINGESPVRALQVLRDDKSACLVSMQRFHGKLGGRQGTFVLQGSETVENGMIEATWFVVPGSATGDLAGLRGEGGFEGHFGKGSDGTLDYWFE